MNICCNINHSDPKSECCVAALKMNQLLETLGHQVSLYESMKKDGSTNSAKPDASGKRMSLKDAQMLIYHTDVLQMPADKNISAFCGSKVFYLHMGDATGGFVKEAELAALRKTFDVFVSDSVEVRKLLVRNGLPAGDLIQYPVVDKMPERTTESAGESVMCLTSGVFTPEDDLERLIAVFNTYYQTINRRSQLYILARAGSNLEYIQMVEDAALMSGCANSVKILVNPGEQESQEIMDRASVWMTMSKKERVNDDMIKAMALGIPVLAMRSETSAEMLGKSGILIQKQDEIMIARCLDEVLQNRVLNAAIIDAQLAQAENFTQKSCEQKLENLLSQWLGDAVSVQKEKNYYPKIQIRGTFASSYSLDIVNRRLAEALYQEGLADTSIHCTQYEGDYTHSQTELEDKPIATFLWRRESQQGVPDIALRNTWPPVVTELAAQYNFENFGWEEDRVPEKIVNDFNRAFDGVGTTSDFVTQALIDSGIKIPVKTMHNGVQLPQNYAVLEPYPVKTTKKHKFLHISSAFPRKGIDVLLKAYFETFSDKDDVCLILKTFPNIHNNTGEILKGLQKKYPKGPEVEWIDCDLPESDLYGLYKAADCYVHSARGEGFGLPVAEAMLAKIPTIVCNNTGLADFCTDKTCLTVGYTMTEARTHLSEKNSRWAEPDVEELKTRLWQFVYEADKVDVAGKVERAYQLITTEYTWAYVAKQWVEWTKEIIEKTEKPGVDIVSTWNTKCGIAEYTRYFVDNANLRINATIYPNDANDLLRPDEEFVAKRSWVNGGDDVDRLIAALKKSKNKVVDIQYNFGFFPLATLAKIIDQLHQEKAIILTFHASAEVLKCAKTEQGKKVVAALNNVYKIIVHQNADVENLKKAGVMKDKLYLLPLGQMAYTGRATGEAQNIIGISSQHVIGSYGFLLPHKGVKETIEAVALLREQYPDIMYIASCAKYASKASEDCYADCVKLIERLGLQNNVLLVEDFLDPSESMILLQACNILAMPYGHTIESASGAVRFCIAAKRPLITTQEHIFDEFAKCAYQIPDNKPETIAAAVERVFETRELQEQYVDAIQKRIEETNWHTIAMQKIELYKGAERI